MATTVRAALESVDEWSDEKLVGQLFCVASGRHAAQNVMGFGSADGASAEELHAELRDMIDQYKLGAVFTSHPVGTMSPSKTFAPPCSTCRRQPMCRY